MSDRLAPFNAEAEEYVLGAMLASPRAALVAQEELRADDFYMESHGRIFAAVAKLGEEADPLTVADKADIDLIRMRELVALTPATANVGHWAKIVRRHAERRKKLYAHLNAVEALYESDDEGAERAERELLEVQRPDGTTVTSWRDLLDLPTEEQEPPKVMTPWQFLEPFGGGRLHILGGYTGDGKTLAAVEFLKRAADNDSSVGFVSLEMTRAEMRNRIISSYRNDVVGRSSMATWKGDILADPSAGVEEVERFQRVGGFDYLIIDHIHAIDWGERRDLERFVRGLRILAIRNNIPVLGLAQLRRSTWGKPHPRPHEGMLRETGMLEAEASWVGFVYRERDDNDQRLARTEFIVAKNRHGKTGSWPLQFNEDAVTFEESWISPEMRGAA